MALLDDIKADLAGFLDPNEFGKSVTYTPAGGSAKIINVIFDDAYQAVSPITGEVGLTSPQAVCKSSDVAGAKTGDTGDTLLIDTITYKLKSVESDGAGMTTLILYKS